MAIGAEPREELAEPSFLELDTVNGGFLVNTELEARTHLYVVRVNSNKRNAPCSIFGFNH